MAGLIVAVVLIPQGMAYAMLAGLPPQVGLYASILPLVLYGALGTSRALAVGPVAIVSLLVATGIGPIAAQGSGDYWMAALVLALMVGLIQLLMGIVRLGFLVNFLSHAVIVGFTNAAALIIGASQLKHILGVSVPSADSFGATLYSLVQAAGDTHPLTLMVGAGSTALLWGFSRVLPPLLSRRGVSHPWIGPITRSGPLVVVVGSILLVGGLGLHAPHGVAVVGDIPQGLPPLSVPSWDLGLWQALWPTALAISFVGFMESIAVAKALASKRRQHIDPNQELVALGIANLGAAFTGGYPVTGGVSRSMVNFSSGANTGLASMITAGLIALVALFFTPLLYNLPLATLAAVILVAVLNLLDLKALHHLWRVSRLDGVTVVVTFLAVLGLGVEIGILVGLGASIAFYLWRTSHPHIAEVGRISGTEHFRNIRRHPVQTCEGVLVIRIDESLYFANTKFLEDYLLRAVADHPTAQALVIICSGINHIDGSALETLETLVNGLQEAGVNTYLSEVKGPVMDQLERAGFVGHLGGRDRIFLTTHQAIQALGAS